MTLIDTLIESLNKCMDIDDPIFRNDLLQTVKHKLGHSLGAVPSNEPSVHIRHIAEACERHDPSDVAVKALGASMADLRGPGDKTTRMLEDCLASMKGISRLDLSRLWELLHLVDELPCEKPTPYHLAISARIGNEIPPISTDDHLRDTIRKLNLENTPPDGSPSYLIRFLLKLETWYKDTYKETSKAEASKAFGEEVAKIIADMGLDAESFRSFTQVSRGVRAAEKIIRIYVKDSSEPGGPPIYVIEGYLQVPGWIKPIELESSVGDPGSDLATVGKSFLRLLAANQQVSEYDDELFVEFVLPWDLITHPVEDWSYDDDDDDDMGIGTTLPVVVRPLELRPSFDKFRWRKRWKYLFGSDHNIPLASRAGWIYFNGMTKPELACPASKLAEINGAPSLREWLKQSGNDETALFGLAFAYDADNQDHVKCRKAAIREGAPVLIWSRVDNKARELEEMLADVDIHNLRDEVLAWRRGNWSGDRSPVVLLWDDPNSSEQFLTTPR
jgi:hypothetical protein